MNTASVVTETVVRNHLQVFLEQKGVAAIVSDYDEDARFYTEAKIYRGKPEIHGFFRDFIASLPARPSIGSRLGACESPETSLTSPGAWEMISLWAPTRLS
jgi:hypothetical protein